MELSLVLGDQLYVDPLPRARLVFMREDWGLCTRVRHHQQKLVLFLSAMRHHREFLRSHGHEVVYEELDPADEGLFLDRLGLVCHQRGVTRIHGWEPADRFFREELRSWGSGRGIEVGLEASPMFLAQRQDWDRYAKGQRRLLMGDFYRMRRQELGILVEEGGPVGGRWSFDEDNRKKLPKSVVPPAVWTPEPDAITREVMELVARTFPEHPGEAHRFAYPVTHSEAEEWLSQFLLERLSQFGPYEDALSTRERTAFHSILTPMLNTGLLTPARVIEAALGHAETHEVPIASLEGFIRQVVGWREFIFWINEEYVARGYSVGSGSAPLTPEAGKTFNYFGHRRKLGPAWWNASTGLPPLDLSIRRTIDHAWCHHIERLMVIGAAMLMAQVDPQDAYQWFMEMFIDSADWVMVPNVQGMSQFADGGLFATKPYLSGSAYLLKMGDYERGPWCEVWDGLYWSFIDRNRAFFARNPRMATMVGGVDRLDPARRERIFTAADRWAQSVTSEG